MALGRREPSPRSTVGSLDDSQPLQHVREMTDVVGPETDQQFNAEQNALVGDARFTTMSAGDMVNVGELVRESHEPDDVVLVGFASHRGSVIAGSSWGAPAQEMPVPPAREGSIESLIHDEVDNSAALFVFPDGFDANRPGQLPLWLAERMPHRAIGVVYHPDAEWRGNYVPSIVGRRYDALLWFTTALVPLHGTHPRGAEAETWPSGT